MNLRKTSLCMLIALFTAPTAALAAEQIPDELRSTSAAGASAYIISPSNGDVVGQTFIVQFGLKGMGVAPKKMQKTNTGHHHLLIDGDGLNSLQEPMGKEVKHFGGGQTEGELTLTPGKHTLQLIIGDHDHYLHNPPLYSAPITVTVK